MFILPLGLKPKRVSLAQTRGFAKQNCVVVSPKFKGSLLGVFWLAIGTKGFRSPLCSNSVKDSSSLLEALITKELNQSTPLERSSKRLAGAAFAPNG